jgi:hypothetical protein
MDTGRTTFQPIWTIQDPDFLFVSGVLLRSSTRRAMLALPLAAKTLSAPQLDVLNVGSTISAVMPLDMDDYLYIR